jgi:hypothetical protein
MVLSFLVLDNTSRLHIVIYVNVSPTVANSLEYALLHTSVTRLSLTKGALAYLVWYYPNYICRGNLVIRLSCLGGHMIESALLHLLITLYSLAGNKASRVD